ncbi:ervatamin-B-like [Cucumis melo var. makuwa]|uniref:Ervatamin-B-like n=1 Tax=Cucumis melo var. makuwa TaxID=1194695 RepID=A0A5A7U0D8_CUCMM|nr:ervatamin-B-like [Cucumis melo var. makuwa]TYK05040.1 ervatamin-B-like [Cucumis melo var. makuwa]
MTVMKFFIVALVLIAFMSHLCESFKLERKDFASEKSLMQLYKRWSSHHRISRNANEMHKRFKVFKDNAKHVFKVNQMGRSLKLRLNQFADMSDDEFSSIHSSNITYYKHLHAKTVGGSFMYEHAKEIPSSIDWRKKGAVNAIKNQGRCGSCWAFAAVAAVESIHQIKTNELVSLSEQEVVDCDYRDGGCRGGFYNSAFEFMMENGGITVEDNYPYYEGDGYCRRRGGYNERVTIDGYENVPRNNEHALMKAVAHQPVAVAIASGGSDFKFYGQAMVVGYGTDEDGDYWIIRNQYGTQWGINGYMKMQRGARNPQGVCGMAIQPAYPVKY